MAQLEVSDDFFKRLQKHAVPLVDTAEDVLTRALDALDARGNGVSARSERPTAAPATPASDLVSHAGRVPHGTRIRMAYKGVEYFAEVVDGKVSWNGRRYKSLSDAAVAVIRSTGSDRPTENGWRVWQALDYRGVWVPLADLRDQW